MTQNMFAGSIPYMLQAVDEKKEIANDIHDCNDSMCQEDDYMRCYVCGFVEL